MATRVYRFGGSRKGRNKGRQNRLVLPFRPATGAGAQVALQRSPILPAGNHYCILQARGKGGIFCEVGPEPRGPLPEESRCQQPSWLGARRPRPLGDYSAVADERSDPARAAVE